MRWRALLRDPRPWLALAAVTLVAWLALVAGARSSPGPLSAVHARIGELAGQDACDACHGSWGTPLSEACGACHESVLEAIDTERGLHGGLERASDCGACHLEHHGPEHALVGPLVFVAAGYEARADYDHARLSFALDGRHDELACDACHPAADVALVADGVQRFGSLDQGCASCHEDVHEGELQRGCAACHGQERAFDEVAAFVHDAAFPGSGAHAELACLECHPTGGPHGLAALDGGAPVDLRGCVECHSSPHAAGFATDALALVNTAREVESCELCHGVERGGFHTLAPELDPGRLDPDGRAPGGLVPAQVGPAWHTATGFALEGPHADRSCEDCHAPEGADFAARHPGRASADCAACHTDPHGDEFTRGAFAGSACLDCHASARFHPAEFDASMHARTSMPLEGAHATADCGACHVAWSAEQRFGGLRADCATCHTDPHGGLLGPVSEVAGEITAATDCATCHGTDTFARVALETFDHGQWTGFALEAAHGRADCAACHPQTERADALGRRFGRATDTFGGPIESCAACHADAHEGAFTAADGAAVDCATCHDSEAFAHVERGAFDHERWTGFDLEGAHARADCGACHPRSAQADANGRRFGRAAATFGRRIDDCATCHADAHGGRFEGVSVADRPGSSCASCHGTESFDQHRWEAPDHGLWTGYPLVEAHASAACTACHPLRPEPDSRGRRFGAARGAVCADCHVDTHRGQFADPADTSGRTDCAHCHTAGVEWSAPAFDHERDSRFSLEGVHSALDCSACHQPAQLADGTSAVRYRPLGTGCGDCHAFGAEGVAR